MASISSNDISGRRDDGLVIDLPAARGWRRDDAVALLAAALVCLLAGRETEARLGGLGVGVIHGLILVTLWWIGFMAALCALDDRTRRWQILLRGTTLTIRRNGLLGPRTWTWPTTDVSRIEPVVTHPAATSWIIVGSSRHQRSLPIGRSAQETREVTARLRAAMGLDSAS